MTEQEEAKLESISERTSAILKVAILSLEHEGIDGVVMIVPVVEDGDDGCMAQGQMKVTRSMSLSYIRPAIEAAVETCVEYAKQFLRRAKKKKEPEGEYRD